MQGAQVVGDTLCGGSETGFNSDAAISSEYGDKGMLHLFPLLWENLANEIPVAAVLMFGDPAHVIGQSYDKGTSTRNGVSRNGILPIIASTILTIRYLDWSPHEHSWLRRVRRPYPVLLRLRRWVLRQRYQHWGPHRLFREVHLGRCRLRCLEGIR